MRNVITCLMIVVMALVYTGAILSPVAGAAAHDHQLGANCPYDGSFGTWTGQTVVRNAVYWYVMKCSQSQHIYHSKTP
jgi:hypothetical protein